MSTHHTRLDWQRSPHPADSHTYSRQHRVHFAGGQTLQASAGIDYQGDPDCADPEQLLLGALASCHMLTFLAIAELQGYTVEHYQDEATAHLEKNPQGRLAITRIELQPRVRFAGERQPDAAALERLHAAAHRNCFIAHSIHAHVSIKPAP